MPDRKEKPSKSQQKRDAQALQRMAQVLVELPDAELEQLQMPETLESAVLFARRITQRGGRKRQIRYVGKLLREANAESIGRQLDRLRRHSDQVAARLQNVERWRERLIDEGDPALGDLLRHFPHADRQHVRRLAREARQQRERSQPPKSARRLFRYLRDLETTGTDNES